MKLLVLTILSAFIVSCASLSQEECQVINWTETGKLDGLKNRNANTFSTYREAKICIKYDATIQAQYEKGRLQGIKLFCTQKNWFETGKSDALSGKALGGFSFYASRCAKYNVKSYKRKYEEGWRQGLRLFCTYDNGYKFGRKGKNYKNTCPKRTEADFLKGLRIGEKEYNLEEKKRMFEAHQRAVERQQRIFEQQQREREEEREREQRQRRFEQLFERQQRIFEQQQRDREEEREREREQRRFEQWQRERERQQRRFEQWQ